MATWTGVKVAGVTGALAKIAYGNGYFLTFSGTTCLRSIDGVTWESVSVGGIPFAAYSLTFGKGKFFITGSSWTEALVWYSEDNGETWIAGGEIRHANGNVIARGGKNEGYGMTSVSSLYFGCNFMIMYSYWMNRSLRTGYAYSEDGIEWTERDPWQRTYCISDRCNHMRTNPVYNPTSGEYMIHDQRLLARSTSTQAGCT